MYQYDLSIVQSQLHLWKWIDLRFINYFVQRMGFLEVNDALDKAMVGMENASSYLKKLADYVTSDVIVDD
jgi:hypothetical protein